MMTYSLSLDGGGSKLAALLFDENGVPISYATAAGVNPRFTDAASVAQHIRDCFRRLFEGFPPLRLKHVLYASVLEDTTLYRQALSPYAVCDEWVALGEGLLGLLACGIYPSGTLVLSGTGSDTFFIKDGKQLEMIGGHGALISDAGSGYAIGKAALEAALRASEGWGPPTLLTEEVCRQAGLHEIHEAIPYVYRSPAPVRTIAALTRCVGAAARRDDPVALRILEQAGRVLAEQAQAMFRRHPEAASLPLAVIGGGFRTHPLLFESFCRSMQPHPVQRPLFEPVAGGMVYEAYLRHGSPSSRELQALQSAFAALDKTQAH